MDTVILKVNQLKEQVVQLQSALFVFKNDNLFFQNTSVRTNIGLIEF